MSLENEITKVTLAVTCLDLLMKESQNEKGYGDITHIAISLGIEEDQATTMYALWLESQLDNAA